MESRQGVKCPNCDGRRGCPTCRGSGRVIIVQGGRAWPLASLRYKTQWR